MASRLILTAEIVSGDDIARFGLAQWVVGSLALRTCARALAESLASAPAGALREAKQAITACSDPSRDGFAEELAATARLMRSVETRARLLAFLDGRRNGKRSIP
jgi:enoyl-CoA hydratase/carnithine racemase